MYCSPRRLKKVRKRILTEQIVRFSDNSSLYDSLVQPIAICLHQYLSLLYKEFTEWPFTQFYRGVEVLDSNIFVYMIGYMSSLQISVMIIVLYEYKVTCLNASDILLVFAGTLAPIVH